MRALSQRQAQTCEEACHPRCRCRCGGALHGASRGGSQEDGSVDRSFFEALPEDDPHHLPPGKGGPVHPAVQLADRLAEQSRQRWVSKLRSDLERAEALGLTRWAEQCRAEIAQLEENHHA